MTKRPLWYLWNLLLLGLTGGLVNVALLVVFHVPWWAGVIVCVFIGLTWPKREWLA